MSFKKRNMQKNQKVFEIMQLACKTTFYPYPGKLVSRKNRADVNIVKVESNCLRKWLESNWNTGVYVRSCFLRLPCFLELRVLRWWLDSSASQKLHKSHHTYLFSWKSFFKIHCFLLVKVLLLKCLRQSGLGGLASTKHQRPGTALAQSSNK